MVMERLKENGSRESLVSGEFLATLISMMKNLSPNFLFPYLPRCNEHLQAPIAICVGCHELYHAPIDTTL